MSGRRWPIERVVQSIASGITIAAMIATPLARRGGGVRRMMSNVVVGSLFTATTAAASRRWGPQRALPSAAGLPFVTGVIERVGTSTGVPFGRYRYSPALQPQVAGVPLIVPLAWFAMALPARETAHAALGRRSTTITRVMLGSAAITAWDLFLDPQMVGEGYWRWVRKGRYRGIPLSNFLGWFVTGLAVMAVLEVALPVDGPAEATLVGEYGVMAAMETLGFAAFFRDRLVAGVGAAAMLPIGVAAGRRLVLDRHWRIR